MKKLFNSKLFLAFLAIVIALLLAHKAYGYDYSTGHTRYSTLIYFSQSVSGEYSQNKENVNGETATYPWKGYGVKSTVGLEVSRFIDFSLTHNLLTMHNDANYWEALNGSRVSGELVFVFASPVGNLRLGGGVSGSHYVYQNVPQDAEFYGSGLYYTLGVNYFVTPRFSLFTDFQQYREKLTKTGGYSDVGRIDSKTNAGEAGFSLWFNWL